MTIRTPEAKVKIRLKEHLRRNGAYYLMPVQTGYGAPSLDFVVCYLGELTSQLLVEKTGMLL